MSNTIKPEELSKAIQEYLEEYTEDIAEDVKEVADKIGKEASTELKMTSPVGARGRYKKGWTVRKDKVGKNRYIVKVWNRTDYQLTHLLEFGHATRNGGRTKAIPHIRPVEEKYSKLYTEELEKKIRRN